MAKRNSLWPCLIIICLSVSIRQYILPAVAAGEELMRLRVSFAEKLYNVATNQAGKAANMVISSLSIYATLAMVSLGARGSTLNEIKKTLNIAENDPSWLEKLKCSKHQNNPTSLQYQDVNREIINSLLLSKLFPLKPEFLNNIYENFCAYVVQADFMKNPEEIYQAFNQRVANQTHGLIKEALPPGSVSINTKAILSNVLYIKGLWSRPFHKKETRNELFYIDDKQSVHAPMMHNLGRFRVGEFSDLGARTIFLPFQNGRNGLMCVLPDEKDGLAETESRLLATGSTPSKLLDSMSHRNTVLTLPKFKISFNDDVMQILQKMGIVELFSDSPDLSGMSNCNDMTLKMFHRSVIELNEDGTEAAASTAAVIEPISYEMDPLPPFEFRADHPFAYYLLDLQNKELPLFVGRLNNPKSQ